MLSLTVVGASLAGCGGDDGEDPLPPVASPDNSKTVKWAVDVCNTVTGWLRDLDARAGVLTTQLQATSAPEQARDLLVRFFEDVLAPTEAMIDGIEELGDPPIEGGDAAAARLRRDISEVRVHFVQARDEAHLLPAGDPDAFATARDRLLTAIRDGARQARVAYAAMENGEPRRLGSLAAQERDCDFVYDDGPTGPEPAPGFSI